MKNFYVIEGEHKNPNLIETILKDTEKNMVLLKSKKPIKLQRG